MNKVGIIITIIFLFFVVGILFIVYNEMSYQEEITALYDHDPENFTFGKPIEHLEFHQRDSLTNLNVKAPKIEIVGSGYSGYDFYMWHKPTEKGKLYIKAFELTDNRQISQTKLGERTYNEIDTIADNFLLYEGSTTIDEGTFEKFYPVRFELWFESSNGKAIKLTEKNYLIDGWDR